MDNNQRLLIELLSAAIRGHKKQININGEYNWRAIFEDAKAHQVHALMYPVIKSQKFHESLDNELIAEWKKYTILAGMQQSQHIKQMGKVLDVLTKAGIEVIALKGLVLRKFYPQPEFRTMSDSDILIHEKDIKYTKVLLTQMGYTKNTPTPKHLKFSHETYLDIEIHWSSIDYNNIKSKEDFETNLWETAVSVDICGIQALTLSLENQIVHVCKHMVDHVMEGFGLRQLCDFVLLVESTGELIDWNLVREKANKLAIERFVSVIFMICKKLFDMKIPKIFYCQALENDPYIKLFINDIFDGGVFGKRTIARSLATVILPFRNSEDLTKMSGKLKCLIATLFPYGDKLGERYLYAKKFILLTPIAWVHRVIYKIFNRNISVSLVYNFLFSNTSVPIVNDRAKLLQWLELQ